MRNTLKHRDPQHSGLRFGILFGLTCLGIGQGSEMGSLSGLGSSASSAVDALEVGQKASDQQIWSLRHEIAEREWQSMRPMVDHFSVELLSGGMSVPYTETISWFVGVGVQKIWDPGIVLGARLYYAPLETDLVREKRPDVWEQYSENYGAFEFQLGTAWQARWGPVPIQWDGALLLGSLFRDRAGYEGWGSRGYIGLLSSLSYEWFYLQGSPKWHRDGTEVALGAGLRWRWN